MGSTSYPDFFNVFFEKDPQANKVQKAYLEQLFQNSQEAMAALDEKQNILGINHAFTNLFGYTEQEVVGKFLDTLIIPPIKKKEAHRIANDLAKGRGMSKVINLETVRQNKKGELLDVSVMATPVLLGKKRIGFYATYHNISKEKKAERALKENEERYRHIVENMQDCFYRTDAEGRLTMVSPSTAQFWGGTMEEMLGRPVSDFYQNPEERTKFLQALSRKGYVEFYRTHLKKKDGTRVIASNFSHFYYDKKGHVVGVEGVFRDVTKMDEMQNQLASSQKLLDDILQGSPVATYVINNDHEIVYWNKALERLTGRKAEAMVGTKKHWEVFYPKKRPMIVDYIVDDLSIHKILGFYKNMDVEENKIEDGIVGSVYFPHFYRGGKWLRFMIKSLHDPQGRRIGAIETVEDISRRKQAEDELHERLKELECFYNTVDATRMTVPLNQVLTGITKFLGKAWQYPHLAKAKIIFDKKEYGAKKFTESQYRQEQPLVVDGTKRGKVCVCYEKKPANTLPIFLAQEYKLLGIISQMISKHIERRQIVEQYKKLVQKSIAAIYIVQDRKFAFVNPEFCRIFKIKPKKVIGMGVNQFIGDCECLRYQGGQKIKRIKSKPCVTQGCRTDGKVIDIELVTQIIDYKGRPAFLGTLQDITLLKAAEAQMKNFNEELKKTIAEKTEHLEEANRRLQSLNKVKDEFISIASHELRSPITTIKGFLSLAREEDGWTKVDPIISDYVSKAYENTQVLNNLVHNILDVSLLENKQLSVYKKTVDIVHFLKSVVDGMIPQAGEKKIMLEFINRTFSEKQLNVELDETRMRQVLRNLIDNAIKFSPMGKAIRVILEKAKNRGHTWLKISVKDEGMGISKKDLPIIFNKFQSGEQNYKKGKWGAGLGLYIVKKVAELHHGFITVETKPTQGSMFSIFLPRQHG